MHEFLESQLAGVIVGGAIVILGNFALITYERQASKKDISKIIGADISFIKEDIERRLDYFNGRNNIDFSGFDADNWITEQNNKYGRESLDSSAQEWFFEAETPLNNELFDKIMVDLRILTNEQFLKIQEFYKKELHLCNMTLNQSESYIEEVKTSRGMLYTFSSLLYIRRLLLARKMANEILETIA